MTVVKHTSHADANANHEYKDCDCLEEQNTQQVHPKQLASRTANVPTVTLKQHQRKNPPRPGNANIRRFR